MFPLVDQKAAEPRGGEKREIIPKCWLTALEPKVTEPLAQVPGTGLQAGAASARLGAPGHAGLAECP